VGNAEAVQDAVQAVGELLIQRVVQVGQRPRRWGTHGLAGSGTSLKVASTFRGEAYR